MQHAYFEGQFVPLDDAKISIKTHAFLYGTSVFEGVRAYWVPEKSTMSIFRMQEHYERLLENSKIFYLTPTQTLEELLDITTELVRRNNTGTDMYIRPTLFKTGENITPTLEKTITDFCLWTSPLGNYLDLEKGLSVCVSSWRRLGDNQIPPRTKAGGAYMNTALAVTDARRMGFDDAVFLTADGHVSEGSAMNLILVRKGKLITPGITDNILEGITRDTVMILAKNELGIDTEERLIDRTELYRADEAFFCGTGAQIAPITQFDGRPVGDGKLGPITRKLQNLYFDTVKGKLPQYASWCTPVAIETANTKA